MNAFASGGMVFRRVCGFGTIGVLIISLLFSSLKSCTIRYVTVVPAVFFFTGNRGVFQGDLHGLITSAFV